MLVKKEKTDKTFMKVLYIISSTNACGGASKSFKQMLIGLVARGIEPLVVCPDDNDFYQELTKEGINCTALRLNYRLSTYPPLETIAEKILFLPRLFGRLIINGLSSMQLIQIISSFRPNIIHTNVSVISMGYYLSRLLKIPHVWHIREYGDLDFKFHYIPNRNTQIKRYHKPLSYTICITRDIQKYHKLEGCQNSNVIYNGILSSNSVYYNKNKKNFFLFVGRIEEAKGILFLIDSYASYHKCHPDSFPLYIAGHGTEKYVKLLREKISTYALETKIVLLGRTDDVLSLYKDAKALIVTSPAEGFGRITAEAMFAGCLVIGYDTAGTKEQFDNGKEMTGNEIALRYKTQEQLVEHLINVTNTSIEHYEPLILKGLEVVVRLYSSEQHTKQVYEFYKKIIE